MKRSGDADRPRVRPDAGSPANLPGPAHQALVRQLGPVGVTVRGRDVAEALAEAYRSMSAAAQRRALGDEPLRRPRSPPPPMPSEETPMSNDTECVARDAVAVC
jgi:hypothetical protein